MLQVLMASQTFPPNIDRTATMATPEARYHPTHQVLGLILPNVSVSHKYVADIRACSGSIDDLRVLLHGTNPLTEAEQDQLYLQPPFRDPSFYVVQYPPFATVRSYQFETYQKQCAARGQSTT